MRFFCLIGLHNYQITKAKTAFNSQKDKNIRPIVVERESKCKRCGKIKNETVPYEFC